jgi:hypothetical protein
MEFTSDEMQWIGQRYQQFIQNQRWSQEEAQYVFHLYSIVTGKPQRASGCGRCFATAKSNVIKQYTQQSNDNILSN